MCCTCCMGVGPRTHSSNGVEYVKDFLESTLF